MQLSSADQQHYDAIVMAIQSGLVALPTPLPDLCGPSFAALASGEFSQIAGLTPLWLRDLLPATDAACAGLGTANLLAWWYGKLYDDLLDGDGQQTTPILTQVALSQAIEAYRRLGLAETAAWAALQHAMDRSAAAHARELASRFSSLLTLSDAQLATWDLDLLIERAAPFLFLITAQAQLAGLPLDGPLARDLRAALGQLVAARQIGDDASDWVADLRQGRLNYVAASLISSFRHEHRAEDRSTLDLDQLAGYQLRAEPCWAAIERQHSACCEAAQAQLAPYTPAALQALVAAQAARGSAALATLASARAAARRLFSLAL
jgi:hypothetical protein